MSGGRIMETGKQDVDKGKTLKISHKRYAVDYVGFYCFSPISTVPITTTF
jgi:hypothetical protein